jgi:hypothetical protein
MNRRQFIQLTSLFAGAVIISSCTKPMNEFYPNLTGSQCTGSHCTGSYCTGSGSI